MTTLLDSTLRHLRALVAFDTRNPPRAIGTGGMFDYLRTQLAGFDCTVTDHGAGAVSLYAVRGKPTLLFNVHLDTVPDSPHWSASPFQLRVDGERAVGLGACDIKGAAAALLTAAQRSDGDAAFLFSTDEEANDPRCIAAFLGSVLKAKERPLPPSAPSAASGGRNSADTGFPFPGEAGEEVRTAEEGALARPAFDAVIVAEPTRGEAVLAHRGISSVLMKFRGSAGHASGANALHANALHQAARWGSRALDFVESQAYQRFGGLTGLRFNIGRIEGGIKANMIAPGADVRFGFRPLPSMSIDALHERFNAMADAGTIGSYEETFRGPSLPAGDVAAAETRRLEARDLADALGLPIGNAVDFWTEASLFSAAGLTAIVYGPGDIAQAHAADEWVALDQLVAATTTYRRLLEA